MLKLISKSEFILYFCPRSGKKSLYSHHPIYRAPIYRVIGFIGVKPFSDFKFMLTMRKMPHPIYRVIRYSVRKPLPRLVR